jgi:hypothetical protein
MWEVGWLERSRASWWYTVRCIRALLSGDSASVASHQISGCESVERWVNDDILYILVSSASKHTDSTFGYTSCTSGALSPAPSVMTGIRFVPPYHHAAHYLPRPIDVLFELSATASMRTFEFRPRLEIIRSPGRRWI